MFGLMFIFTVMLLFIGARYVVLENFYNIEASQHSKGIHNLVQSIETKIRFIESIGGDYAEWDDTYSFMEGKNEEYLNENFREGTDALKTLGVDFMYFVSLSGEVTYTIFQDATFNDGALVKRLLKKQPQQKEFSSVIENEGKIILFHRHLINNSDSTKTTNGYLYVGVELLQEYLKKNNQGSTNISFVSQEPVKKDFSISGEGAYTFKIASHPAGTTLLSNIALYDDDDSYVLSIIAAMERTVVMQGQKTTYLFSGLVFAMLGTLFILFYRRQTLLEEENIRFESLVEQRTAQLNTTMQELQLAIQKLERIAYEDELTGILTRRSFFEKVAPVLDEAHAKNYEVTFAMIDLDDFKKINDNYGHDVGDSILKHFCTSCERFLDNTTLFARLGGEEFVICFNKRSLKKAIEICTKIQDYIHHNPVKINEKLMISYTASIGIANNETTSNVDLILKEADEKLYQAKDSGKNIIRSRGTETLS